MLDKILVLKEAIASTITGKGIPAYSHNTFLELANKISSIPTVSISGVVKRTSKINVVAPYEHRITLTEGLSITDITTTVLEYIGAASGVVHYEANYNNGEASSFEFDPSVVEFDGFMKIKDSWSYQLKEIGNDSYFETDEINLNEYNDLVSIDLKSDFVEVRGIRNHRAAIKATGDISLFGVDSLDKIELLANTKGAAVNTMALSFDSGTTWYSYDGQTWISVDVNDLDDFKNKGMTETVLKGLTDTEFSVIRDDQQTLRFAYFLERPTFDDSTENDAIKLFVTMTGYNIIAPTAKYSYDYDPVTKTLIYKFLTNGTFTVNYVDGN